MPRRNRIAASRMDRDTAPPGAVATEPASITDEALMQRYAAHGDGAAFESLYRRYRGTLLRYLERNTGSAALAEELFQEVWMKVVRARSGWRPDAAFRTWLFTLAHNRLVDHWRSHGRLRAVIRENAAGHPEPDAPAPAHTTPQARGEQADLARVLLGLLRALPAEQRDAFLLKEEGGFSLEEIAAITGAGHETVKSRLRYAVAKLRDGLEAAHAR